jgi:hypothetical protein
MEAAPLGQTHRLQAFAPLIAAQRPRLLSSCLEPDLDWLPLSPPAGPAPKFSLQQAINMALHSKQFALQQVFQQAGGQPGIADQLQLQLLAAVGAEGQQPGRWLSSPAVAAPRAA